MIPRNHWSDPLVLMNVSRRWSQFITSSPPLWSYVLIDTDDDDVMEYMQLSFLLSRNRRLFIVLHGSRDVCGDILVDLLQVGNRIDTLVYPPNVSRTTLARFRLYLGTSHDHLEHIWQWSKLEVQSGTQPQRYLHYTFPISTQSLSMSGLFPLSRLVPLSNFQSLSFLSVRISLDRALPPARNYRLELPKLEVLKVQMTLGSHDEVDTPINLICRNLKLLDLRYTLELDIKNAHKQPAIWMEFGEVDGVEELQIDLAIHCVTEVGSIQSLSEGLPQRKQGKRGVQLRKRLQRRLRRLEQWEQLEEQLEVLEKDLEELEDQRKWEEQCELKDQWELEDWWNQEVPHYQNPEDRDWEEWEWEVQQLEREERAWVPQWLSQWLQNWWEKPRWEKRWREQRWAQEEQRREWQRQERWWVQRLREEMDLKLRLLRESREWQESREWWMQQVQYLRFTKSMCTHWR